MTTIFAKIIRGELPCTKVYEDEKLLAIKDIHPVAPVHLLIIVKKPLENLQAMQGEDFAILADVGRVAQKLAVQFDIEDGYRLITNSGEDAGQTVFHLHFHLIGGRQLLHLG